MFLLNKMPFSYMRDIMDNFQAGTHSAHNSPTMELISCQNTTSSLDASKIGRFSKEIKAKNVRTVQQRLE
jgi:hypothetical protein